MAGSVFLTGTDTDAGKTYTAALLIRMLRARGLDAVGMKPLCCGSRSDAEALHAASGQSLSLNEVNPVWLRTPAAPYTAAMVENRPIDLALIRDGFAHLRASRGPLIVEGVGGWRVPIADGFFLSDLAAEFALPVMVVVANKLGALNHCLLTVESIQARGLVCAGVILNQTTPEQGSVAAITNRSVLESLLNVPILGEIAFGQSVLDIHWPL